MNKCEKRKQKQIRIVSNKKNEMIQFNKSRNKIRKRNRLAKRDKIYNR